MKTVLCDNSYAEPILAIFNDAILHSTALYDYKPRTPEMMTTWFEAKQKGNYPVIGALGDDGRLMGFGSYGTFRAWPAYKYTVEHSLYVAPECRGRGVGHVLLKEIIARARAQNCHVLVGGIDSLNTISIHLHRKFGFQHAGTIRQAGFKFGKWLDLEFHQLILETPAQPMDG
ncbi:MAG TPA: GNAT family N-acetyltransferase [Verrucomicrobiae bacterium]|nr:GNAT family N-acetyltransferase [Verrucomicrobiae bacterium]